MSDLENVERSKKLLKLMAAASLTLAGSNVLAKDLESAQGGIAERSDSVSTVVIVDEEAIHTNQANGSCGNSSCSANGSC